jgi:hypothetical protein
MSKWDVAWRVQRCPAFFIWRGLSMSKIRKVSVEFEYDSDLAIAVKAYCLGGEGEEATPAEMRRWFYDRGVQNDEDALDSAERNISASLGIEYK